MSDRPERKGLGRGLSALLADAATTSPPANTAEQSARSPGDLSIPIEKIHANPDQPRRDFDEAELAELAKSIEENGVIQPLVVRPDPQRAGAYQIVAGERRWRAAQRAKLHTVPAVVRELNDGEVLQLAIIENIQRSDLNPLEEAAGYRQLMDRFGHTQERLADGLGKSRSHIANLLRLLTLPDVVQEMLRAGALTAGHARALITASDPVALARQVTSKGLSVRQTEALAKSGLPQSTPAPRQSIEKDADTKAVEADLSAQLSMRVTISPDASGEGGELKLKYRSLDQLDALLQRLSH